MLCTSNWCHYISSGMTSFWFLINYELRIWNWNSLNFDFDFDSIFFNIFCSIFESKILTFWLQRYQNWNITEKNLEVGIFTHPYFFQLLPATKTGHKKWENKKSGRSAYWRHVAMWTESQHAIFHGAMVFPQWREEETERKGIN